jgi:hypothetical protein
LRFGGLNSSGGNSGGGGRQQQPSSGSSSGVPPGLVVTWPGLQMWPGAGQVPQQALLAQYQASHVQQQAAQAA